ncbi:hypothetical protein AN640_06425 [Candidatus Epulonipiscium fishelsonii]|uniref:Uncharacterized protein n=1 Tax=Candidatus Epulonipiscium fishelsonii TaxID=77094 RepID=A0ACC8XH90_9FIRM|nr:hypothetical protein AN640_06425 [Epulopiscium sp. SCG-D08WGA-EpuloA1]
MIKKLKTIFKSANTDEEKAKIKDMILKELSEIMSFENHIENTEIIFKNYNVKISINNINFRETYQSYLIQIMFNIETAHQDRPNLLEENFIHSATYNGSNLENAIHNAVLSFNFTCIEALKSVLFNDEEDEFNISTNTMRVFKGKNCIIVGRKIIEKYIPDPFDIIKASLDEYLNNKNLHWISIYCVNIGKDFYITTVNIDGIDIPELSNMLNDFILQYGGDTFFSFKNTYILKPTIPNKCIYSKAHIEKQVLKAIDIYTKAVLHHDMPTYKDKYVGDYMLEALNDKDLTLELLMWLPQIVVEMIIPEVKYGNQFTIRKQEEEIVIRKMKLTHYYWVHNYVKQLLFQKKLEEEFVKAMMRINETFNLITEAIQRGEKLENLFIFEMVYYVDDDYKIR